MEHLTCTAGGSYLIDIKFKNCSNNYIEIIFLEEELNKILEPDDSFNFLCNENNISFIIKEHIVKKSFFSKIAEIFLAFLVSIPLWFINYFEMESIDKSIQFSTKFKVSNLKEDIDYNIIINNSSEKYKAFNLYVNNELLSGEIECSEKELIYQILEYRKSLIISWAFPILIVICLLIVSIKFKSLILTLITTLIISLLVFFLIKNRKKNKLIIEEIKQKLINTKII